jgi:thiol-disulfide isomerase/thioredoxin
MSGTGPQADAGGKKQGLGRGLTLAIVCAVLVGVAAVLYVIAGSAFKPGDGTSPTAVIAPLASGAMAKLKPVPPAPPPDTPFIDASGKEVRISDFKGQVLVVNIWATWCGPCVTEMPTLAALQKAYEGKPVKVLAISIDPAESTGKAKAFIARQAPLDFFQNADMKLPFALAPIAQEFPTTVIYDQLGVQRLRMTGDTDWSTPEAKAVIDRLLAS